MKLSHFAFGQKGQTALEGAFVVLFIILAVGVITGFITTYSSNMQKMAEVRTIAQGIALEMTMGGNTTHIIRVDPADEDNGAIYTVDVFAVSEDCTGPKGFEARLSSRLGGLLKDTTCSEDFFSDVEFP